MFVFEYDIEWSAMAVVKYFFSMYNKILYIEMEILSETEFINIFSKPKKPQNTFESFYNSATVNNISLKEYLSNKSITKDDVRELYKNIVKRNEYLSRFYNLSLRIQESNISIDIPPMKSQHMNNNQDIVYKNMIRNIHYKDILQNTKSGMDNTKTFFDVLKDLYLEHKIDYKLLTPSAIHYIKEGRIGSVFSSYYFRASIMNPYLVYSLNLSVLKGTRIFTPTLGWSSYMYGFLECNSVIEYVGTDVIPSVCEKTKQLAKILHPEKKTTIYCKPSENLAKNESFLNKYKGYFDVVFFSPPYYTLEIYEGGKQSTEQYKTYEEWLDKYWEKTIQLCYHVLTNGGKICYVLSGYGSENTTESYDLIKDMNSIAKKYFKFKSMQPMYNKNVHVTKHKDTSEKIIILEKKI